MGALRQLWINSLRMVLENPEGCGNRTPPSNIEKYWNGHRRDAVQAEGARP
jgi:hypothetical protein